MPASNESPKRAAYSPKEFAELFGKSQTWGYRQIYAGKVQAITEFGRILIPANEVELVLEKAGIYNGMEKPKAAKARQEKLNEEQRTIWQRFVKMRQDGVAMSAHEKPPNRGFPTSKRSPRSLARQKIAESWKGKRNGR